MSRNLAANLRVVGQLELAHPMRLQAMAAPDALHRTDADAARSLAMAAPVQCVASPGGSASVIATTRSVTSAPSRGMRDGRVLSRSRPSTPSRMKRSCQRQTQVLDVPVCAHDLGGAAAIRRQQHDPRSPDVLLRAVPIRHHRLQTSPVSSVHFNGNSGAHVPNSHTGHRAGIPIRTLPSGIIH